MLQSIRGLFEADESRDFAALNFQVSNYHDSTGRLLPAYRMTKDGYTLLAMAFTGKKAVVFKIAYIQAFNAMAAYIKNQRDGLQYRFLAKELEVREEKNKVSACAREMRKWQDTGPKMSR